MTDTYRPDWVPEDAKKMIPLCHVMKGVKEKCTMASCLASAHPLRRYVPYSGEKKLTVADYVRGIEQGTALYFFTGYHISRK